jgi:hypothetical protein
MQFIFDGRVYKAIKITGPKHNLLGLVIDNKNHSTKCEIICLEDKSKEININSVEVMAQVLEGIEEINNQFGLNYAVRQIQFIPADTPSKTVYKELTIEIFKRLISEGEFTRV